MKGMSFKTFPLMGTWFFAAAFLMSHLWHCIFRDGWGFLISGVLFLSFAVFSCGAIIFALMKRTRGAWYRCLICVIAIGLFVPAITLGGDIRNEIFLHELPTYQKITDLIIDQPRTKSGHGAVQFPAGYSSNLLNDKFVSIQWDNDNEITVLYITRDSSAVGHGGYLYRSDDDAVKLEKQNPDIGIYRIAPHWFLWGD